MTRADLVRLALLAFVGFIGFALVALRLLGGGGAAPVVPTTATGSAGQGGVLAEDLAHQLATIKGVSRVTGSYIPGTGVVISVQASGLGVDTAPSWLSDALIPVAQRVPAGLATEHAIFLLDVAAPDPFTRAIAVPLGALEETSGYVLSTATGLSEMAPSSAAAPPTTATATAATANAVLSTAPTTTPSPPDTATESSAASDTAPAETSPSSTTPNDAANAPGDTAGAVPGGSSTPNGTDAVPSSTVVGNNFATGAAQPYGSTATEKFDTASQHWNPLAGQWRFVDGTYQQLDNSGYDFINQLAATPGKAYSFSAKMRALEGDLSAGIMILQPKRGSRNGATMIDLTDKGSYIRWGHYDNGGVYVFDGGNKLATPIDAATGVVLKAMVKDSLVRVYLNDKQVGEYASTTTGGLVGLVSSLSKVAFDDVSLVDLG